MHMITEQTRRLHPLVHYACPLLVNAKDPSRLLVPNSKRKPMTAEKLGLAVNRLTKGVTYGYRTPTLFGEGRGPPHLASALISNNPV